MLTATRFTIGERSRAAANVEKPLLARTLQVMVILKRWAAEFYIQERIRLMIFPELDIDLSLKIKKRIYPSKLAKVEKTRSRNAPS